MMKQLSSTISCLISKCSNNLEMSHYYCTYLIWKNDVPPIKLKITLTRKWVIIFSWCQQPLFFVEKMVFFSKGGRNFYGVAVCTYCTHHTLNHLHYQKSTVQYTVYYGKKSSKINKILGNQYEITTVSKFIFLGMFWLKSLNLATIWLILPKIIDKCEKSCII